MIERKTRSKYINSAGDPIKIQISLNLQVAERLLEEYWLSSANIENDVVSLDTKILTDSIKLGMERARIIEEPKASISYSKHALARWKERTKEDRAAFQDLIEDFSSSLPSTHSNQSQYWEYNGELYYNKILPIDGIKYKISCPVVTTGQDKYMITTVLAESI